MNVSETRNITIDTTLPTIGTIIASPEYTTYVDGLGYSIYATASDARLNTSACEYYNGTDWYSATWNGTALCQTGLTCNDGAFA